MYYCENCHLLCEWPVCGYCGTRPLREPRADDYCFLSSRNEPWAQMLAELLQEERIAVVTRPVPQRGFGYSGERSAYTELFVPFPELERAKELERALLSLPGVTAARAEPVVRGRRALWLRAEVCGAVSREDVLAGLRTLLPERLLPRELVIYDRPPVSANGKWRLG